MRITDKANQEKMLLSLLSEINGCLQRLNDMVSVLIELQKSNTKLAFLTRPTLPSFPRFKPQNASSQKTKNKGKNAVEIYFPKL